MDQAGFKEQLQENKKMLIALGVTLLFGAYMLFPSGSDPTLEEADAELEAQLAALQADRDANPVAPTPTFDGFDERNISVDGGGEGGQGAFQTKPPLVSGRLVGFGTKTDYVGEYLVAHVSVIGTPGFEVDMRKITQYELNIPVYLDEETDVRVWGDFVDDYIIQATAMQ